MAVDPFIYCVRRAETSQRHDCPEGPSTQHFGSLVSNTTRGIVFLEPETLNIGYSDPVGRFLACFISEPAVTCNQEFSHPPCPCLVARTGTEDPELLEPNTAPRHATPQSFGPRFHSKRLQESLQETIQAFSRGRVQILGLGSFPADFPAFSVLDIWVL